MFSISVVYISSLLDHSFFVDFKNSSRPLVFSSLMFFFLLFCYQSQFCFCLKVQNIYTRVSYIVLRNILISPRKGDNNLHYLRLLLIVCRLFIHLPLSQTHRVAAFVHIVWKFKNYRAINGTYTKHLLFKYYLLQFSHFS